MRGNRFVLAAVAAALLHAPVASAASVGVMRLGKSGFTLTRLDPRTLEQRGDPLGLESPSPSSAPDAFERSPDGERFAVINGGDAVVLIFDDTGQEPLHRIELPKHGAQSLAWLTGDRLLALDYGIINAPHATVIDTGTGEILENVVLPGGERVGGDVSGRKLATLQRIKGKLALVFVSPEGEILRTVKLPGLPSNDSPSLRPVISLGRKIFVLSDRNRRAALVDRRTGRARYIDLPHKGIYRGGLAEDVGIKGVIGLHGPKGLVPIRLSDGQPAGWSMPRGFTDASPKGFVAITHEGRTSTVHGYDRRRREKWTSGPLDHVTRSDVQFGVLYLLANRSPFGGKDDTTYALDLATGKVLARGKVAPEGMLASSARGSNGEEYFQIEEDGD